MPGRAYALPARYLAGSEAGGYGGSGSVAARHPPPPSLESPKVLYTPKPDLAPSELMRLMSPIAAMSPIVASPDFSF